jgi:hypothetical protein
MGNIKIGLNSQTPIRIERLKSKDSKKEVSHYFQASQTDSNYNTKSKEIPSSNLLIDDTYMQRTTIHNTHVPQNQIKTAALLIEYKYLRQSTHTDKTENKTRQREIYTVLEKLHGEPMASQLIQLASNRTGIGFRKVPKQFKNIINANISSNDLIKELKANTIDSTVNYSKKKYFDGNYEKNVLNFYQKHVNSNVGKIYPINLGNHRDLQNLLTDTSRGGQLTPTINKDRLADLFNYQEQNAFEIQEHNDFQSEGNLRYKTTSTALHITQKQQKIVIADGSNTQIDLAKDLNRLCEQTKNSNEIILMGCGTTQSEQKTMPFAMNHKMLAVICHGEAFIIDPKSHLPGRLSKVAVRDNSYQTVYAGIQGATNTDCTRYVTFLQYYLSSYILKNPNNTSLIQLRSALLNDLKNQTRKRDIANYLTN